MLPMMEEEKKTIFKKLTLLKHYFLYVVYDGATENKQFLKKSFCYNIFFLYIVCNDFLKTHSVITLFFVCCL